MRIPVILMLLTILLLPADLQGLAAQVQSGIDGAQATATKLLHRNDDLKVAEVSPQLTLGGKVAQVR